MPINIIFITNTPPIPTWGGAMAFYRHFCTRPDFKIFVITDDSSIQNYSLPYLYEVVHKGKLWQRLANTRFFKFVHSFSHLIPAWDLDKAKYNKIKAFNPEAIFTVAGSWSWMALLAKKVSKKLNIPLIASFNDWWDYSMIYHPYFKKLISKKFLRFYQICDLALCTSEGMREALGEHRNSIITYPTGAMIEDGTENLKKEKIQSSFVLAFTGNMGNWYGKMLEDIVKATEGDQLGFELYGSNPNWSEQFDKKARNGLYKGQLMFDNLEKEIQKVDALLLLMGFDDEARIIETTSFKTKFLDYIAFQKPILLWGPEYCSAVKIAKEYDSAEICTDADPKAFRTTILALKSDPGRQQQLVKNSFTMYQQRFHPDVIHQHLLSGIKKLVNQE